MFKHLTAEQAAERAVWCATRKQPIPQPLLQRIEELGIRQILEEEGILCDVAGSADDDTRADCGIGCDDVDASEDE